MGKAIRLAVMALLFALAAGVVPVHSLGVAAAKGTVHVSLQPNAAGYLIRVSGTYTQFPSDLEVFVHAGAQSCPGRSLAENRRIERQVSQGESAATALMHYELGTNLRTSGSFSEQAYWGLNAHSGTYMVCAYLLGPQASAYGSPADPPQARASARLTMGAVSAPAPATSSPAFTLLAIRPELNKRGNWNLNRPSLHIMRSGQNFWLVLYVRVDRAMSISVGKWRLTERRPGTSISPSTYNWTAPGRDQRPLHFRAGDEFNSSSPEFTLLTKGPSYVETFSGGVTINGVTEKQSTWVRVVR